MSVALPRSAAALAVLVLTSCATVRAPTGGPADTTPPTLVAAAPADGTTNVTERTLRLAFSERLAAASVVRAVQVVPEGAAPPRVRARGDEIEVRFDSLREATTYVVTIGTDLTDDRGVKLASPITVAFATGDQIDRGEIAGTVRDPVSGRAAGDLSVLAYRSATPDLSAAPDYRTGAGSDGRFRLAYLRPDSFFVVAVADLNRNGRVDAGERVAVPPRTRVGAVPAGDSTAAPPDLDLWIASRDTVPPEPRRARAISDRRFAVRFDEPVQILERGAWALADSASGRAVEVTAYQDAVQPAEVRFQTAAALPAAVHTIRLAKAGAVADSSGTPAAPFALSFTPSGTADTLGARFAGFLPADEFASDSVQTLRPGQDVGLRFAAPPDAADLRARVRLVGPDSSEIPAALVPTLDGLGVRVTAEDGPLPDRFSLRVAGTDTTYARRYSRLTADDVGAVVGTVPDAAGRPVIVEARLADGTVLTAPVDADGAFSIPGPPPGPVRLRLFEDLDGDGAWSPGRLPPRFVAPEPLVVVPEPADVRARWDTEVDPTRLRLPTPDD